MTEVKTTTARRSDPSPPNGRVLQVLLVEDSPADAALVRALLDEVGDPPPSVRCVPRLRDAQEVLSTSTVDCVLLDLGLPDAQGVEAVQEVVAFAADVTVVVLTGLDDDETALRAVHSGAQDYLCKRDLSPQLLWRTMRNAMERNSHERSLVELTTHDQLTGLANRQLFVIHLDRAIKGLRRGTLPLAVMFVDLDSFKWVNDSLGHDAGDQLLCDFAERLGACLRPHDVAGRLGGDEFLVLCEQIASAHVAESVAARIHSMLQRPFRWGDRTVWLRASIGVTLCGNASVLPEELIWQCDQAMYRAKLAGKGQSVFFDEQLRDIAIDRLRLVDELHHALLNEEFRVHYQPIVDLASGRAAGAEALVRRMLPGGKLAYPVEFIWLAEDSGIILPLGDWILDEVVSWIDRWTRAVPAEASPRRITVNASAAQIADPDFARRVRKALEKREVDPARLGIEVTESSLMQDETASLRTLRELKQVGVSLSIDDFGTGYSSLTYLQRYPFDVIKVDQSFVQLLGVDPAATAIVEGVVRLGDALGLGVVAEGVESQEQADLLRELGCPLAQGFLFARPTPPDLLDPSSGMPRRTGPRSDTV